MRPLLGLLLSLPVLAQDGPVALERAFPRLRFERPVLLTHAGDGTDRVFVVEQGGVIRVLPNDDEVGVSEVFLDLSERVSRQGNEEGLLGLAFAPDHATSGTFYVHYSSSVKDEVGVVARFQVDPANPSRALAGSEEVVLEQPQPYRNHNGGSLEFGPDGMLYVSFGDGGAADDPHGNGQDLSSWLGAILRVDVSQRPYAVPTDNPFVGREGAAPEVWAYGLRNVWRFSFDRETGDLWAGDVGQNEREEVDLVLRGGNYGWNAYEASLDFAERQADLDPAWHSPPVAEYGRGDGISITGGYVYRGARHPDLVGRYFYGDYFSGNLWSLRLGREPVLVARTGRSIAAFGEDEAGELYLTSFDGGVYRVVPSASSPDGFAGWPAKLSETGLFASLADRTPGEGVVAYDVTAPFWSDGAAKERFLRLPEGTSLGYRATGAFEVPVGSMLVKHFRGRTMRRDVNLETRLIERTPDGWTAATFVWDRDQRDATLAPAGQQFELYDGGVHSWHAPSASECATCHVAEAGFVLGLNAAQLDAGDQLARWREAGLLAAPDGPLAAHAAFVDPADEAAPLEQRARTWLDVNCAMCHYPDGPGNASFDARYETPLAQTGLVDAAVTQGDLGVADARLVAPGDPERSMVLHRVATLGDGRMPSVGSNRVDRDGVLLLTAWIEGLEGGDEQGDEGWTRLFDGESLTGWTQRNGTATYRVEDGAVVGRTTDGSPNSFLCTDRGYDDFELTFEVRVDDRLNSGVQIRSTTRGGFTGRVNGPQVEVEASGSKGAEAGYLYAEAAGGWMTPGSQLTPHKTFRDGEWNRYLVRAEGANIKVWINDVLVSDLTHEGMYASHPRGFVGLQVHGIGRGQGPYEVAWRDIRIRELRTDAAGWRPSLDGESLAGWRTTGNWYWDAGELVIEPREGERGWQRFEAYLVSEARYGDFVWDLEYAYPPGGNSGVFFRIGDPADPVATGIECQILDSSGKEGELGHHDHGGIIRTVGASRNMSRSPGEWNRMVVVARGARLVVELNGREIIDTDLSSSPMKDRPLDGHLGLQDHGVPHTLRFRNLWLKELE